MKKKISWDNIANQNSFATVNGFITILKDVKIVYCIVFHICINPQCPPNQNAWPNFPLQSEWLACLFTTG